MVVYLVHHNLTSMKVSMLDMYRDAGNCSELLSVIFCTIANYTLLEKCVLLIAILLQLSSVKMSQQTKYCKHYFSASSYIDIVILANNLFTLHICVCIQKSSYSYMFTHNCCQSKHIDSC